MGKGEPHAEGCYTTSDSPIRSTLGHLRGSRGHWKRWYTAVQSGKGRNTAVASSLRSLTSPLTVKRHSGNDTPVGIGLCARGAGKPVIPFGLYPAHTSGRVR
ncbi:uncharacterized protein LOC119574472 [Penaeus monodon]|uniref:uncharacterized protein LOC119574472 n=1 Tax=Penaeus monodon TaxID=6687 RepID=UPI0018A78698|nr:uncharacterized protein LOC119574472 [Penaeus monodon]